MTMPKVKKRRELKVKGVEHDHAILTCNAVPTVSIVHQIEVKSNIGETPSDDVSCMVSNFRDIITSYTSSHPECKEYAPIISKYLRNQFSCMGIKATPRRSLQDTFLEEKGETLRNNRKMLLEFVRALWEEEERDFQGFATDLMCQFRDVILGETEESFQEAVDMVEYCVVTKSWWDTVDTISYKVLGYFVKQNPPLGLPVMKKWIDHENMWLRRVAILHQLGSKEKTDSDLLFEFCLKRAHETEFFIRKAIGWALRELAKTNKTKVKRFVEDNKALFSGLTIREALKHC